MPSPEGEIPHLNEIEPWPGLLGAQHTLWPRHCVEDGEAHVGPPQLRQGDEGCMGAHDCEWVFLSSDVDVKTEGMDGGHLHVRGGR